MRKGGKGLRRRTIIERDYDQRSAEDIADKLGSIPNSEKSAVEITRVRDSAAHEKVPSRPSEDLKQRGDVAGRYDRRRVFTENEGVKNAPV